MNATLWVIWPAVTIAVLFSGLAIGSHFPAKHLLNAEYWNGRRDEAKVMDRFREQALDRAWREGYEKGCDDELASCAPCEHEPLARGAASTSPAVTTAPCPGEQRTLKGDSPGPGPVIVPRLGNFITAPPFDVVFVPANPGPPPDLELPIFDQVAAGWPQLATSPAPPGGVAPEPSAPGSAASPDPTPTAPRSGAEAKPPRPGTAEVEARNATAGPGADPWQEIVAANQEVWEPFTDTDVFSRIGSDLSALRSALAAPIELPPWKGSQ